MPDRKPATIDVVAGEGTVFLVDDDPSVCKALRLLLRATGLDVEAFTSAEAFLGADLADRGPRCLVLDLKMPQMSGLEVQQRLIGRKLELPVVFISAHADFDSGVRALKGGAVDFLRKPFTERDLLDAIARALERDRTRRGERLEREILEARARELTPREREVFALVAAGFANKRVGADLGAAEATIKLHRARVMQKMQAESLADLVRMADKLGLRGQPPAPPSPPKQG
jgi:FixJ family two-component response regulator